MFRPLSRFVRPLQEMIRDGMPSGTGGPRSTGDRVLTAIEFGPTLVKVARVRRNRAGTRLLSLQVHECAGLSDPQLVDLLKKTAPDSRESGEVILLLPLSQAISRTLRLPSHEDAELGEMVRLQVRLQVPLRSENITYGYRVASTDGDGYSTVYLAIMDRAVVDRAIDILKSLDLAPDSVQLNTEGLLGLFQTPETATDPSPGGVTAILDFDRDSTSVGLAVDGKLAFTRSLSIGAIDLWKPDAVEGGPAQAARANLCAELRRTFVLFEKETKQPGVGAILLSGVPECCGAMGPEIEAALSLPVRQVDPSALLEPGGADVATTPELWGASLTALLGLLLRGGAAEIELLPHNLVRRRHARAARRVFIQTSVRVVILLILITLVAHRELSRREARLGSLDAEIRALVPIAAGMDQIEERLDVMSRQMEAKGMVLELLREVHSLAPPDMSLNRFAYSREKGVVLKGTAANMAEVFSVVPKLEASPLFRNVLVEFASKRAAEGGETTDFQLDMNVEARGKRHEAR